MISNQDSHSRDEGVTVQTTQHCARCKRQAPEETSDEFSTWEVIDELGDEIVCEGCLLLVEERAIQEDSLLTALDADLEREV
jgi:hypothetical protein